MILKCVDKCVDKLNSWIWSNLNQLVSFIYTFQQEILKLKCYLRSKEKTLFVYCVLFVCICVCVWMQL